MAVTSETLHALRELRIMLDRHVDDATRRLVEAWANAWQEISDELRTAIEDLIELGDGEWPTRGQVLRAQSAVNGLKVAGDALAELADQAGVTITAGVPMIVEEMERLQQMLVSSQLPTTGRGVPWTPTGDRALEQIVRRSTRQITALTRPLSMEAEAAMRQALIRGVAVGDNPRRAATRMLERTRGAFDGGLHRATTIARTEMLDAHRAAALESRKANLPILAGWQWAATLSSRTCPACLSLDGTEYPAGEPGPNGHPNCRCTALPITKTWAELGIQLDEPDPLGIPAGREWFDQQPEKVQRQIMGAGRFAAYRDGRIGWDDMATLRHNSGWRDSWQVAPVG